MRVAVWMAVCALMSWPSAPASAGSMATASPRRGGIPRHPPQHHPSSSRCCWGNPPPGGVSRRVPGEGVRGVPPSVRWQRLRGGGDADWEKELEEEAHMYTQAGTQAHEPAKKLRDPWDFPPVEEAFEPGEEVPDMSGFWEELRKGEFGPPPPDATDDCDHGGWIRPGDAWDGLDPRLKMAGSGDSFTPEQYEALGVKGAYTDPRDGLVKFAPPGMTEEDVERELDEALEVIGNMDEDILYAEYQRLLDENWRPWVKDPMEWTLRDGGFMRRPEGLNGVKDMMKESADFLQKAGYTRDPKTGNFVPPRSKAMQQQEMELRKQWQGAQAAKGQGGYAQAIQQQPGGQQQQQDTGNLQQQAMTEQQQQMQMQMQQPATMEAWQQQQWQQQQQQQQPQYALQQQQQQQQQQPEAFGAPPPTQQPDSGLPGQWVMGGSMGDR